MQKVSVLLDEKGIPAMGDLVTKSVIEAICGNFNALYAKGLVVIEVEQEKDEPMWLQDGFNTYPSIYTPPHKPTIRLIPNHAPGAVLVIKIPQT